MDVELYRSQTHKFPSKPAGHDAARQRENQRRHRARVKSRITELEEALSSTQSKLGEALRQIEVLTTEVQRLSSQASERPATRTSDSSDLVVEDGQATFSQQKPSQVDSPAQEEPPKITGICCDEADDLDPSVSRGTWPGGATVAPKGLINTATSAHSRADSKGAAPLLAPKAGVLSTSNINDPNDDCPLLPPPTVGESTIPCREAYAIIKERTAPESDLSVANEWLKPGFRRAIVPGTGCRVQTHLLFAFVDHITPI